jgi:hypothetical protein
MAADAATRGAEAGQAGRHAGRAQPAAEAADRAGAGAGLRRRDGADFGLRRGVGVTGAKFGFTETRLGLIPATIGPYVLARMGEAMARRVFMSARLFDAEEAVRLGLLARAVAPEDLDARSRPRCALSGLRARGPSPRPRRWRCGWAGGSARRMWIIPSGSWSTAGKATRRRRDRRLLRAPEARLGELSGPLSGPRRGHYVIEGGTRRRTFAPFARPDAVAAFRGFGSFGHHGEAAAGSF